MIVGSLARANEAAAPSIPARLSGASPHTENLPQRRSLSAAEQFLIDLTRGGPGHRRNGDLIQNHLFRELRMVR